ncbi:hypothetical protein [Pseudoxanthomonas dokdonensis]|uniref:General secretion pathway protein GspN n=1 Tax=Pseudoxanthomonas dokdonensis TaxID=344882 RepID=A0A0R0CJI5_9GAMM|nr:hypothetical protein [Pseudoxanthomonas dokdonensis]KRG69659.1 hypothetical protein ABB29_09335 [Pseudoxanthomonas dokdonensis]
MRAEHPQPRIGLLVAVAAWSTVLALAALLGLGGFIRPLPADPSLAPALPKPAPAGSERLGPPSQYTAMVQRPLFYPSRTPQPFFLSGEGPQADQGFDYVLSSVLITPQLRMAILQPSDGGEGIRVKEGEAPVPAPQWRLVELAPRNAVFEGPDGRRSLELRVFDGSGEVAPPPALPVLPPATGAATAPAAQQGQPTAPAAPTAAPPAASQPPQKQDATSQEPTPEASDAQMEAIRKRIEERRRRLREAQKNPPAAPPQDQTQ